MSGMESPLWRARMVTMYVGCFALVLTSSSAVAVLHHALDDGTHGLVELLGGGVDVALVELLVSLLAHVRQAQDAPEELLDGVRGAEVKDGGEHIGEGGIPPLAQGVCG